jgi:small subunit ribosomal protein S16
LAVKLRLHRTGRKKQPYYRIVATDTRAPRDGRYIDRIGHYIPLANPATVTIDREKALDWLKKGAVPSTTVKNFFRAEGIMLEFDLLKRGLDEAEIEKELQNWQTIKQEQLKRLEAEAAMKKRADSEKPKAEKPEPAATETKEQSTGAQEQEATVEEEKPAETEPDSQEEASGQGEKAGKEKEEVNASANAETKEAEEPAEAEQEEKASSSEEETESKKSE